MPQREHASENTPIKPFLAATKWSSWGLVWFLQLSYTASWQDSTKLATNTGSKSSEAGWASSHLESQHLQAEAGGWRVQRQMRDWRKGRKTRQWWLTGKHFLEPRSSHGWGREMVLMSSQLTYNGYKYLTVMSREQILLTKSHYNWNGKFTWNKV